MSSSTQCPTKTEVERWTLCAQRRGRLKTHGESSEQRATKRRRYGREVERATRDATETGHTRSRACSARRNRNGTSGKANENCATPRNGTVGKNGREMSPERTMLADHSKNSSKQPSRTSRTNLSHTLGRRREATARQSNIVHNGSITTNITTNYFTAMQ